MCIYRRLSMMLLVIILLGFCTGCNDQANEPGLEATVETVGNLFDVEPSTETISRQESLPQPQENQSYNSIGITNEVQQDDLGAYLVYEGNEMHLGLRLRITDLPNQNIGIHLYVDGQPQPYYTAGNEVVQYMHIFPSQNGKEFTLDLIFTPVVGQAGDMLEIGFAIIAYPEYFIDETWTGITMIDWCGMGLTVRTKYMADPPAAELPVVNDHVLQLTQQYIDLTASEAEMFSSGEYQKEVEYEIHVNNQKSFGNIFSVTNEDKLEIEFELKGSSVADFGLVLYLDHQPVSVNEEDMVFVRTQNGKKVTVKAQIDLSSFACEGVFYAVIVPRNYRTDQLGGSCLLTILGPYYLSDAESLDALQGSDKP